MLNCWPEGGIREVQGSFIVGTFKEQEVQCVHPDSHNMWTLYARVNYYQNRKLDFQLY